MDIKSRLQLTAYGLSLTAVVLCLQDLVKDSYRAATSKTAQRTLLNTVLLVSSSLVLFGTAAVAYILFYQNHLPDRATTVPIHLQYGFVLPGAP